jgi:hypothetical protein
MVGTDPYAAAQPAYALYGGASAALPAKNFHLECWYTRVFFGESDNMQSTLNLYIGNFQRLDIGGFPLKNSKYITY